ncbi:bifunctional 2',3'-cyclic-nucleotide 2'-phosphodiesterase/3'-nucleotidase [Paenibacillus sp.]|jgi:2',3'-cyclic-nucleotide 2'-phosphodiesterase/3'-nucleotidase|uniref:bifunctional 2',3'-cyclic-nucleotide 2'-phosphodiesterase/3'-nucleotidase n=1 Tax=Paenibacillus sp. TaxID=58172 RepID=UPI002828593F|nr:bifunctional 2',3'-cyclic-nucleotide 2'-phosphodiesterase/3'-nucleotidase [Paenibacillus sp.]MDR0269062.1 bifunctional 2',3'-cyclic-nucleotide 2'-phosphodiesterase/3'-nucleotidase [Paenibacillus sp.]
MSKSRKKVAKTITAAAVAINVLAFPFAAYADGSASSSKVKLRLMETTDLHVNMVNYDYYSDKPTDQYGFAKTASLINAARKEAQNNLLFDNGDLLQGNPLGDYKAKVNPLKSGEIHPVYKAMGLMNYDAGGVGNHEFNYGLDFLKLAEKGANFPIVNANIYKDDGDKDESNDVNYFTPYTILNKKVIDENGQEQTVKVGVIAFAPPQIMQWDSANLVGKVIAKDMVQTAKKFIPQMKKEGADIIVAIPHSGFEDIPQTDLMENSVLYLSKVEGIDAIMFGHAHKTFPSAEFKDKTGVDLDKGTINGVPSVEPGFWGDHLGIIDLDLEKTDGKWKVISSKTEARAIYDVANKKALVDADQKIIDAVKTEHEATIEYVRGPVGKTTAPINSYFALVQDDPSIQIVTNAQKWYVEKNLKGTEYENLPVLSAGAPFKAGGRSGASYYTNIPAGTIAIKNVSDLYVYPNTVHAVVVTGEEVQNWLEWSAGQFNQIDASKTTEQPLINNDFPTYNYDVIDGLTYQIDVTQPNKYDLKGNLVNADANRIKNLQYNGKPIDSKQKFVVATNNYRASSSKLANPDGKRIIMAAPDENRQVIIDYIREHGTINPSADNNWSFAPVDKKLNVTFTSSPDAKDLVAKSSNMAYVGDGGDGFAKYSLDLSVKVEAPATETTSPTTTKESKSEVVEMKPTQPATEMTPARPEEPKAEAAEVVKPTQPVTKPAPQQAKPSTNGKVYVIKKGDNLYRIGLEFGVAWENIAKANGITNVRGLKIGQQIMIP